MARAYLMGIDNGGTVTKAALYDEAGTEIAVSSVKSEMRFPHPGHAEKSLDDLWSANARVISEVMKKAGVRPAEVAGVAVAGHGNGLYLVDADGVPTHDGINSADSRAAAYVAQWYADGTFEKVFPRTCQAIWAAQPPALLAWFRDHDPRTLERTRWILMCKDYIRLRLTGEVAAELTDSSGTNLMNIHELRYDPEVLRAYGLADTACKLPPVRRSADICGRVTRAAAEATGLREGTPVAGGLFDIDACSIASGITDPGRLCLIAGSWSINEFINPQPITDPDIFMTSAYCVPGWWLITEASATSASNLEWLISEVVSGVPYESTRVRVPPEGGTRSASMPYESTRVRVPPEGGTRSASTPYERINAMVDGIAPGDSDVTFLPFLFGSNEGPAASGSFLGLRGWHGRAHLLRAVYEGVTFSHKRHIERLLRHRALPQAARIAGGAAKSDVWVRMFADVLQLPIECTACEELGAMGAALCAGVAVGLFGSFDEGVGAMVRVSRTVEPRRENREVYQEKFARYQKYVAALQGAWLPEAR